MDAALDVLNDSMEIGDTIHIERVRDVVVELVFQRKGMPIYRVTSGSISDCLEDLAMYTGKLNDQ